MFEKNSTLGMARALTAHVARREAVTARNIANADTPGYRAQDIRPFAETYRAAPDMAVRTSRAGHIATPIWQSGSARAVDAGGAPSPNGNTVSLEDEMFRMADLKSDHGRALGVYQSGLALMRSALGRS